MPGERRRVLHLCEMGLLPCARSPPAGDGGGGAGYLRVVYCNDPGCPEATHLDYPGNAISTTRYTVANFIPKSLFEQFRRVANVFFLIVGIVSFSPLAPYRAVSVLLPLIVVVGATMIKEAFEDWRRKTQVCESCQLYG